jgi:hypothetical protein
MVKIPTFKNNKELHKFLVENKELLIAEKKSMMKRADGIDYVPEGSFYDEKINGYKANNPIDVTNLTELKTRLVINSCNWMDSHKDVHIQGIWKKNISENKNQLHLQEHALAFDKVIASKKDLRVVTEIVTWADLGYSFPGSTECLVFYSTIKKSRNPFMFDQYAKGFVDNHSVGMQYVSMVLCVNEPDEPYYGAEYEAWEKYYPLIVNKEAADESGYFWAVKEAKCIEGSAVPIGSNIMTPTLDNNLKTTIEPDKSTQELEPVKSTLSYDRLLELLN